MFAARRIFPAAGAVALAVILASGCSSSDSDSDTAPTSAASPSANVEQGAAIQHLDPTAFATTVGQPNVVLLDVRTAEEFAAGHLPKATNIDMQGADFADRLATLDKAASYALYCRTGHRSGIAAEQMRTLGFTTVVDLAGGITAWAAEGRTVTTA